MLNIVIMGIFLAFLLTAILLIMVSRTSYRSKTPLGINTCENMTEAGNCANRTKTPALVLPSRGAIRHSRPQAFNGGSRRPTTYLGTGERKSSSCFFISLRLGSYYFPEIRSVFVEALPETVVYCVAVERGESVACNFHLHCYVEFKDKFFLKEVRNICYSFMCQENFDCQTVKNRKKLLSYISKEDLLCYFNCKLSDLSFNYQAHYYLSRMQFFDFNHPFVKSNRFCYKYLQQLYHQLHQVSPSAYCYIGPIVLFDVDWCLDVFEWYRDFVSTSFYFKKKHLYLYGVTNVGKSFFIRLLLSYLGNLVYTPSYTHYFESLTEDHKAIFWDEFDFLRMRHNESLFKLVFAGEKFPITRKYHDDRLFQVTIPCILVSNYKPAFDEALMGRFKVIYAGRSLQVPSPIITDVDTFRGDIEDTYDEYDAPPSLPSQEELPT